MEIANKYKMLSKIGQGGMGSVYLALDRDGRRKLAIKVSDSEVPEAVTQECAVSFALRKVPNIVETLEIEQTEGGQLVIVMEFLQGGNLRARIGDASFATQDRILALHDVVCAMQDAQTVMPNFGHFDIKPENCLLTEHGMVKVADFGLSCANGTIDMIEQRSAWADRNRESIWCSALLPLKGRSQAVGGAPVYMAPEQILGECENGPAADVYSIGIMACEMFGADIPLDMSSLDAVLMSHVRGIHRGDVRFRVRGVPRRLRSLIKDCLCRNPARRPMLKDLRLALLEALHGVHLGKALHTDKRVPNATDDAIRKASSLFIMGFHNKALQLIEESLSVDVLNKQLWDAGYALCRKHPSYPDVDSLFWIHGYTVANLLRGAATGEGKAKEGDAHFITRMAEFASARERQLSDEEVGAVTHRTFEWVKAQEEGRGEEGEHNYTLCIRCGEMKMSIIARCPRCGFSPMEPWDVFLTNVISCQKSGTGPVVRGWKLQRLRELSPDIADIVENAEYYPGAKPGYERFLETSWPAFRALAIPKSLKAYKRLMRSRMQGFIEWTMMQNEGDTE